MKKLLLCLTFFAVCLLTAGKVSGAIRYIAANGSDSNDGINKTTPWLHAPGMTGCSANCASYTPQPGDQIILRGGDTWHVSGGGTPVGLPWIWAGNGTAAAYIYIGVDFTFFSGASWTRPKLNGDNPISSSAVASCAFQAGPDNRFLDVTSAFTIFDNLEFLGLCAKGGALFTQSVYIRSGRHHISYKNLYIHGWTHPVGATSDDVVAFQGNPAYDPGSDFGSFVEHSVVDGTDTDCHSGTGLSGSPPDIHNSIFRCVGTGLIGGLSLIHDNLLELSNGSFDPAAHRNMVYATTGPTTMYNNVIRHITTSQVVVVQVDPCNGGTDYYYNNVVYDGPGANTWNIASDDPCTTSGTGSAVMYNNTIQAGSQAQCIALGKGAGGTPFVSVTIRDNQCITDGGSIVFNGNSSPLTASNNLLQTNAQATSQGYVAANSYAPTAGGSTIGAGLNLAGLCLGNLASLCKDTSLGGLRLPVARPLTSPPNWDIGAYQFAGAQAPTPPSNLKATVQ